MTRIVEIETRLAEIKDLMTAEDANIDELNTECDALIEERSALIEEAQTRQAKLEEIAKNPTLVEEEIVEMEEKRFTVDSVEYRHAWMNNLRGVELSEVEQRAWSSTEAVAVIPTQTANDVLQKIRQYAPLTNEITMLYVPGKVTYAVEDTVVDAADHIENAVITASQDVLTSITLVPTEICKLVQISETVKTMSVDAFEAWLIDVLAESIAKKIGSKIIATLSGLTATASTIDAANLLALLGAVKGNNVKLLCNNKTLFTEIVPLQDKAKNSLVNFEGAVANVYGREIMIDERIPDSVVYAGDFKKIIGDLPQNVQVKNQFDINTNSYKFLGVAMFDAKLAIEEAFAVIK